MARIYLDQPQAQQAPKKRIYLDTQASPKKRVYLDEKPKNQSKSGGAWRTLVNQLIKPIASVTNAGEDIGKLAGYAIAKKINPNINFKEGNKKVGIDFLGHQKDVWTGNNQRTPSTVMKEIAAKESNPALKVMQQTLGYGGDFLLDPLNKLKIAALTEKGNQAIKTGNLALSAGEQAAKGQRALVQFGKMNILPSVGNRVLAGASKLNDALRATKYGAMGADALATVSTSIRPSGVSRGEFKVLSEAKTAAKNIQNYTKDEAIQFAASLEKTLRAKGASPETRSAILHAIEKGDKSLAPQGLDDVFEAGVKFKGENEAAWKALGGSSLDDYGLAHVATDEVAEQARKKSLSGGKLFSTQTPQDIHREWVKVDGKVVKLSDEGIKYKEGVGAVDDITSEARKYTSAEEFVKSQGTPVYRGGADLSKEKITDAGVSVSRGKNVADDFVKQKGGTVQENFISPNAKIVDYADVPNVKFKNLNDYSPELDTGNRQIWRDLEVEYQKAVNWAKSNGYDGVKLPLEGETRIINPDVLKTKSQLTDLWKKANQSAPEQSLLQEARKFKSAEEFVNSFNLMKSGEVTSIGQLPISKVNKTQIRAITERGLPHTDTGLKVKDFTPGRKVTQPLEVYSKGGSYVVENGNHRLAQALANGDTHIPVVFKRGEGKTYSTHTKSQLTDLWKKAQGGNGGYFNKAGKPVNVEQATAKEINESLAGAGKSPIFKEDLPTVVARMGISTGKKKAGVEFLEATKGLEGKAKELANEAYEKITNVESVRSAIKAFDNIQNIWKAQVLVAPSYHIRNEVGNLWNNFLANVGPNAYVKSSALQKRMLMKSLSKSDEALIDQMKKLGVIGTGQYGGDITKTIADELGGASVKPWKQNFGLYKGNRAVGSVIEDNAKIAHYLQKIGDGFTPKAAAESVKKYLFDYSDLTWGEQNILKRVMPFYTWTRKNIPLQVQEFVNNPGKFSKAAVTQKNIEEGVETPDERYLSDFIKSNSPMRWSTNSDGSTSYLLLGQWLPAASAVQMLTQDPKKLLEMISPVYKIPKDFINNQSFFKNSLGESQPIEKYPGEMKSFLGMDMGAKTANVLRNIRVLSELDKLNPGGIFGGKDTPSRIPGGSQNRGARQSPDAPEATRWRDFILGKTQTYDQDTAKYFYDRDTENRMSEYTQAFDQALRFKNPEQAKEILREMEQFQAERAGGRNKTLDQFNLMGDQYLEDRLANKQAEYARDSTREKMKELIKEGVRTQNPELLRQAAMLDPTYIKEAIKAVTKEMAEERLSDDQKRGLYEIDQMKTEKRLNPFYTR